MGVAVPPRGITRWWVLNGGTPQPPPDVGGYLWRQGRHAGRIKLFGAGVRVES